MIRSGLSPAKSCTRPPSSSPTIASAGQPDVVDEDLELLLRADDLHRDRGVLEAGGVGRHDEQARLELAGLRIFGPRDDQHVGRLVDAGDVDLLALEHPLVAVAAGGGGDVVGVGAGVGLGDREGHRGGAVADAGEPPLLLLLGAVARDDRAADRRADDHHQQRAALRGELLADRGDVADAAATAAVLLGEVDAEVAGLGDLQPQLGGLLAGAGALDEPVAAVACWRACATWRRSSMRSSDSVKLLMSVSSV